MMARWLFLSLAVFPAQDAVTTESFDRDPGWEGVRNRLAPRKSHRVIQDFGYAADRKALGGTVGRSITPAWYGRKIAPKTLHDALTLSGTVRFTGATGGSGVFLGWFNAARQGFRPINSLALRLDGERTHATLHVDYATATWKAGGLNTRIRIPPDGAPHRFRLAYDPAAEVIRISFDDAAEQTLAVAPGHKAQGATFDRFGLFNLQLPGDGLSAYFTDIEVNGARVDLTADPGWEGSGNRTTFQDAELDDTQNYGWSDTNFAGGRRGEIGGTIWRPEPDAPSHGYYGDRVGPLSLDGPLTASGRLAFTRAAVDSGVYVGWFSSAMKDDPPVKAEDVKPSNFVGFVLEGPSAVGHYWRIRYGTSRGARGDSRWDSPFVLPDGKPHEWTLSYDPAGQGRLTATLDGKAFHLDLSPGHKAHGASFDRFGLFTMRRGGHFVTVYLDDLRYTRTP